MFVAEKSFTGGRKASERVANCSGGEEIKISNFEISSDQMSHFGFSDQNELCHTPITVTLPSMF